MNNISKHMSVFFRHLIKKQLILCAILFALTFIIMILSPQRQNSVLAYENLISIAGIPLLFSVALLGWILLLVFDIQSNVTSGNGLNVLMMLPGRRRHLFISLSLVCLLTVLMVFATQLLALLAAYAPTMGLAQLNADNYVKELVANQGYAPFVAEAGRTNGLYLAMVTSDLFRFLLPQSLIEFVGWATVIAALSTSLPFMFLCGTRIEIGLFGVIVGGGMYNLLDMRLFDPYAIFDSDYFSLYILPAFLAFAACAYMIFMGIRKLNSHAKLR